MFQIQCLKSASNKATEFYSKYSIGPFLKGQSTTVGNALRRVLLSNLQGLAITGVRITGIDHEFSTIPNVKEDVVDILLNLKQIILKGDITEPTLARLSVKEAGIIVASDIVLPNGITFVDSRQYITSLTDKGNLEMEFLIAKGQNYLTSEKLEYTIPERFLAIDAVFMPVTKVNFFVEPTKNSSSFDLESLILEIWTNGSIMPDEALSSSAEILENTFGLFKVTNIISSTSQNIETPIQEDKYEHLETIFIEELELSVRAYNCLKRANVHTLSDLLQYSADDLLEFKNFGQKSADEVCENLKARFDLDLRN
jgi:DNA-directed RNA polymerase subunit alpha|tara:strand:- start:4980 stop:5915 length:936 start_codon:yes stop_codon:yes gene_type:complete